MILTPQIPLMILQPYDKLDSTKLGGKVRIYMQQDETFEQLKGRLVKILNQKKADIYDDNTATEITSESVRLWKS